MLFFSAVKHSRFRRPDETQPQMATHQWASDHGGGFAATSPGLAESWERHAGAHPIAFMGEFFALITLAVSGLWVLMEWLLPF